MCMSRTWGKYFEYLDFLLANKENVFLTNKYHNPHRTITTAFKILSKRLHLNSKINHPTVVFQLK